MEIKIHYSGSSGNLTQIDDLLIDPGVPINQIKKALNYNLSNITGCLISHSHGDHAKGLTDMLKSSVDCCGSIFTGTKLGVQEHRRYHIIEHLRQFKIGDWKIKPFSVPHDVPNLGFVIAKDDTKILYITDANYCPVRVTGLTHILIGANYCMDNLFCNIDNGDINERLAKRIMQNHMSIQTCKEFLKANDMSKVKEIHLIHLSDLNSDAERFKREIMELTGIPTFIGG